MPAGRSGAAPRGAKVKAGGDGGRGTGRSVRCGAPRGGGSSGRRRGEGGVPAGRSGAAPRGAEVQAGGDGEGRGGTRVVARVRRLTGPGFKRAAKAGRGTGRSVGRGASRSGGSSRRRRRQWAGRRVHRPGPVRAPARGWPYPLCRVRGGDRAGAGAPCAPREHPDYIYQRVVSPQAPTTPSPITQSGQGGSSPQGKSDIPPPPLLFPGSGPLLCGLAGGSNPRTPARSEPFGPPGACSGPGCAPGNHRGALAMRRAPHPTITLSIHPGQRGAAVSRAAGPGARATRARRTRRPGPPRPPPPALPHPTDRPVPTTALAARLNPHPAGRRAGPTGRPVPLPALAACLNPHPVGRRARATAPAPPLPLPSPPVLTFALRGAAPDRPAGPPLPPSLPA